MRINLLLIFLLSPIFYSLNGQVAFFEKADAFFKSHVKGDLIDYQSVENDDFFLELLKLVEKADPDSWSKNEKKAFYINAYNILVIKGVLDAYPIASVQDVAGFFDRKRHLVAGKTVTLNELEKEFLLKPFADGRLHFVLVCGAKDCPPIIAEAYVPERLDEQMEQQTHLALNDPDFIRIEEEKGMASLSQIFQWYVSDFGGSQKSVLEFINSYRSSPISEDYGIGYYNYDWSLNGTMTGIVGEVKANNAARYVVSSTIPKGNTETKIFNNLYTQRTRNNEGDFDNRTTFFTTIATFLYGASHRVNVGFEMRYRIVRSGPENESPFDVLGGATRQGVTTIGPKIRIAPVPKWTNFSIQSALWLPIGDDLTGSVEGQQFIDWDGPSWWTQIFNDFPIGNKFSLFTELDVLGEDIGSSDEGRVNRWSTPAILIFSYFPTPKATIYGLANYSPFWQQEFDYFYQLGIGSKYQFNPNFELELSYTYFENQFLNQNMGRAATYNLGVRFNL